MACAAAVRTRPPAHGVAPVAQAPEIIRMEKDAYGTLSDVYAYGVVLFELLARRLPYPNMNPHQARAERVLSAPPVPLLPLGTARAHLREQVLFMVGMGRLRPTLSEARSDLPHALYVRAARVLWDRLCARLSRVLGCCAGSHERVLRPCARRPAELCVRALSVLLCSCVNVGPCFLCACVFVCQ